MNRTHRISILLSILIVLGVSLFIWFSSEKYRGRNTDSAEMQQQTGALSGNEEGDQDEDTGEEALDADDPLNIPDTLAELKNASAYVVDREVCDSECARYETDKEALAYCQAVCGFAPTEGGRREAPADCSTKTETDRDICLRDKAVAENNSSLCSEIVDKNLRTSCHNRIAEEQFDH